MLDRYEPAFLRGRWSVWDSVTEDYVGITFLAKSACVQKCEQLNMPTPKKGKRTRKATATDEG